MAALISVACNSEKSAIKEALKESLVDPGSLVIDKVVTSEDSRRACIKYNSKNKFDIYVGKKNRGIEKNIDAVGCPGYGCLRFFLYKCRIQTIRRDGSA